LNSRKEDGGGNMIGVIFIFGVLLGIVIGIAAFLVALGRVEKKERM